jgi:hypothetical protein
MIQTLVNANADKYATDNNGRSCLHITCMESIDSYRLITVQKLVDIGVDVVLEDNFSTLAGSVSTQIEQAVFSFSTNLFFINQ